MKISTKGTYGLRAMVDLALHSATDTVALNSIAERQNISANYLEHVFSSLRKAGLVKSVKGSQGGYSLGNSPANITVGQILRVLEGDLFKWTEENVNREDKLSVDYCVTVTVWDKLQAGINDLVDSITLEDLVVQYKKINNKKSYMFYI